MTHPPGPQGLFRNRHLFFMRRHPRTFLRLARKFGDLVYFRIGTREVFLLSDPAAIEQVFRDATHFEKDWGPRRGSSALGNGLLTSEGADHRAQRQKLAPLFARATVEASGPVVERIVDAWSRRRRDGESIDLLDEMSILSTVVAMRVLFGSDADAERVNAAVAAVHRGFGRVMFPHAHRLRVRRIRDARLKELVKEVREEHDGAGLLAPLLEPAAEWPFDVDEQIATFVITGTETIRLATTWAWFHLATRPDLWPKVAEKRYAEAVLLEAMRLHPPQWMIGRRTMAPYRLGEYVLPAGALLLLSPYVVQRDARWFAEPERFDPERWLGDPRPARGAYFPFGGGARRCIGEAFAMSTATMMVARIARHWKFACGSRPRLDVRLTLQPRAVPAVVQAVR